MIVDMGQDTLENLLSNMNKIEKLANIHGFKNMAIFKPLFFTDSHKLNFVATPAIEGRISFFQLAYLELELAEILKCKILFFPEDKIDKRFKKYIHKNKILLIQDNQDKITRLFVDILSFKEIKISNQSSDYIHHIIFQRQSINTDQPRKY